MQQQQQFSLFQSNPVLPSSSRVPAFPFGSGTPVSTQLPASQKPTLPTPAVAGSTGAKCNGCKKVSDAGSTRYVCLICEKFDLCETCYKIKRCGDQTGHRSHHPMQPIAPRKQICGSNKIVVDLQLYCCALCGDKELKIDELVEHCQRFHAESPDQVHCPICVTFGFSSPNVFPNGRMRLMQHLRDNHWNSEAKMICKVCHQPTSNAKRFACLICEKYQLCDSCHQKKAQTDKHVPYHPMQLVEPKETLCALLSPKAEPVAGGEPDVPQDLQFYCCSYCGETNFGVQELAQHCKKIHKGQEDMHKVRCPVCAVLRVPIQESSLLVDSLLEHLGEYHCTVENTAATEIDSLEVPVRVCAICLDEFMDNERFLRCGHSFHDTCITPWLKANTTCPICRTEQATRN